MRRPLLVNTMGLTLLLAFSGVTAAQEASPELIPSASPAPLDVMAEPLPVADYWVEWIDHKEASHARAIAAIDDAKRSISKTARWYQTLVGVHKDELHWLANHEPLACYQSEYERWRGAVEDLHSIHTKALRLVRAKNVSGLRKIDKQRRGAMKRLNRALANVADCGPSEPNPPSVNPMVGTWKTVQRFVSPGKARVNVTHHARTKFTRDGRFLLRVERDDFCRQRGLGFVPLTARGRGEFVTDGTLRFDFDGGRLHCYPRSGGRKLVAEGVSDSAFPWRYDEAYDVVIGVQGGRNCSWRAKTGSAKDCKAFWRGTPAPVEDMEASVEDGEAPLEVGAAQVEEGA